MREWSEDAVSRLEDDHRKNNHHYYHYASVNNDGGIMQDNSKIFSVDLREVTRYYEGV